MAIVAKSFARIHRANLINWGILPLELTDPDEWGRLEKGHHLRLSGILDGFSQNTLTAENQTVGACFEVTCVLTERERSILLAGGVLAHIKART